jgi:hypothetical protein
MAKIKISGVGGIALLFDVMRVIGRNDHVSNIGNIFAALEPSYVFEHLVAVIRLSLIRSFEELQLNGAAPFNLVTARQAEPDVNPTPLRSSKRLL